MAEANKQVVRAYFEAVSTQTSDPLDHLADDVVWWVPQGSSLGGTYEGKAAVAALMAGGVDAYSADVPMTIDVRQLVAEDDWVCARVEISAAARDGTPYRNQYHFAFRLADGRIREVHEYVDTRYVHEVLGL